MFVLIIDYMNATHSYKYVSMKITVL